MSGEKKDVRSFVGVSVSPDVGVGRKLSAGSVNFGAGEGGGRIGSAAWLRNAERSLELPVGNGAVKGCTRSSSRPSASGAAAVTASSDNTTPSDGATVGTGGSGPSGGEPG